MQLIGSDSTKCVGCNRCVRECPIETANLTYLDEEGNIKVKVNEDNCIICGACVSVCKHDARFFCDETERFFADIAKGEHLSVIIAPALKVNFPEWKRILSWLRNIGIDAIYDVSLGADICIWGHLRYLEINPEAKIITQPCPAIVSYCELHQHDLLPYISPVQSPMASYAIYLRKYAGVKGKIVSISPCIAKSNEHLATGVINYNITFAKLEEYMTHYCVELPNEESDFDSNEAGLGSIFPMPGGLKENLEYFLGKTIRIDEMEGLDVYHCLDEYAKTPPEFLPDVFDVLNCRNGCSIGPACASGLNLFQINYALDNSRQNAISPQKAEENRERLEYYDKTLKLNDFLRKYEKGLEATDEVTETDIQKAFRLLEKDTFSSQNFNCGACGANTCRDMARRIALGLNIPINCIFKARDDAEKEHKRNARYLSLVHRIGEDLLSLKNFDEHGLAVINSLRALCDVMEEASLASIWRRYEDGRSERLYGWFGEDNRIRGVTSDWPEAWMRKIEKGNPYEIRMSKLSPDEQVIIDSEIKMMMLVPIILKEEFWGFIVMATAVPVDYRQEELSVIDAVGILIASSIIEKELTEGLIVAREEAFSASRAKGSFLSNMSHEMRTPMNAILGMTSIGKGSVDLEQKNDAFEKIQNASNHLLGVINDILDISKIEAGKLEIVNEPFDFHKMLANVIDVVNFRIIENNQDFLITIDENIPPSLIGDEQRLSQVITNLLSNAIKFTPEGGKITLSASVIASSKRKCRIKVVVKDTGIGISSEQQTRLFAPFQQAENSTSRKFGGTGLGLAISKNIIEMMGGEISLKSAPGEGSTFWFNVLLKINSKYIPVEIIEEDEVAAAELPDLSGYCILLAEDVEINREIVIALLEPTNLSVDWVQNGADAVRRYNENPEKYALIFMDLQMPEMDGLEATRLIRASENPGAADIPIIAMTANVFREDVEECLEAGMNQHIGKPIDIVDVIKILREYVVK